MVAEHVTYDQVVRFVKRNTQFDRSQWCPEEEIVWVLSWYEGASKDAVRELLERAVAEGTLERNRGRYTDPTPQL